MQAWHPRIAQQPYPPLTVGLPMAILLAAEQGFTHSTQAGKLSRTYPYAVFSVQTNGVYDMQRRWWCWCLLLLGEALGLLSCAPLPTQPGETQPYALLVFPEAIRLVALDSQTIDSRVRISTIRVAPGLHRLRMVYTGPSPQHAGQQNDPFCLDTYMGQQYLFETRTRGIIWRPEIVTQTLIPGYCTAHQCSEGELHIPRTPHGIPCPATASST
jgi:hypothetical protein